MKKRHENFLDREDSEEGIGRNEEYMCMLQKAERN